MMKMRSLSKKHYAVLLIASIFMMIGCDAKKDLEAKAQITYSPPVIPISISLDSDFKVSLKTRGVKLPTPIGVFELSASIESKDTENRFLIIYIGSKKWVYLLENNVKYQFQTEPTTISSGEVQTDDKGNISIFLKPSTTPEMIFKKKPPATTPKCDRNHLITNIKLKKEIIKIYRCGLSHIVLTQFNNVIDAQISPNESKLAIIDQKTVSYRYDEGVVSFLVIVNIDGKLKSETYYCSDVSRVFWIDDKKLGIELSSGWNTIEIKRFVENVNDGTYSIPRPSIGCSPGYYSVTVDKFNVVGSLKTYSGNHPTKH
ncbi:MAG TPA: hypothetical protein PKW95_04780 [bacterium]|nr:hypothetical protein [bacterium]